MDLPWDGHSSTKRGIVNHQPDAHQIFQTHSLPDYDGVSILLCYCYMTNKSADLAGSCMQNPAFAGERCLATKLPAGEHETAASLVFQ